MRLRAAAGYNGPCPPPSRRNETVTPAIVIRARAFGESDKIVTFLTRDRGKLSGIAKGAKRSKRRFVNVLEPFTHVSVRLRERSSSELAFISACDLVDAYHTFARDLTKFAHASYVLELTDRMVRGHEAGREIYDLVRETLALLDRSEHATSPLHARPTGEGVVRDGPLRQPSAGIGIGGDAPAPTARAPWPGILRAFELRLLRSTGYEVVLDRCTRCGTTLAPDAPGYAHPARGGVSCGACRGDGRTYVASPHTLRRLRELQTMPLQTAQGADFMLAPGVAAEARILVRGFLSATLTAPLASERLLETL